MENKKLDYVTSRLEDFKKKWEHTVSKEFALIVSEDGSTIWASTSTVSVLGYTKSEMLKINAFSLVDAYGMKEVLKILEPSKAKGCEAYSYDVRMRCKSGRDVPLSTTFESYGTVFLGIFRPIDNFIRVENAAYILKTMHPLVTSLTILKSNIEELEGSLVGDAGKASLIRMKTQANIIQTRISALRSLEPAKAKALQKADVREKVFISEIVEDVKRMLHYHTRAWVEGKVAIDFDVGPSLENVKFRAVREDLMSVLYQLMSNAFKVTTEGTIKAKIFCPDASENEDDPSGNSSSKKSVVIQVEDTGPGFSYEEAFKAFHGESVSRHDEGYGLGLFQVQKLAGAMGGEAFARPNPIGVGSVVGVIIKLDHEDDGEGLRNSEDGNSGQRTLLLAEDHLAVRKLIARKLEKMGHTVLVAGNGFEGLKMYQSHGRDIDIVLTDINMPIMDGIQLADGLRREGFTGSIIGMSANSLPAGIPASKLTLFVRKPVNEAIMRKIVSSNLRTEKPLEYKVGKGKPLMPPRKESAKKWHVTDENGDDPFGPLSSESMHFLANHKAYVTRRFAVRLGEDGKEMTLADARAMLQKEMDSKAAGSHLPEGASAQNKSSTGNLSQSDQKRPDSQKTGTDEYLAQKELNLELGELLASSLVPFLENLPLPVGIANTKHGGACVYANDAFCKLIGRSRDEVAGMFFHDLIWPEALKKSFLNYTYLKETQQGIRRTTIHLRHKDGHHVSGPGLGVPVANGRFLIGLVLQVEKEPRVPNHKEDETESRLRVLKASLDMFSHDVRSPLHACKFVINELHGIKDRFDEGTMSLLDTLEQSFSKLNLLATTRLSIVKNTSDSAFSSFVAVLRASKRQLSASHNLGNLTFDFDVVPECEVIREEALWVYQIISNLVGNSFAAKPKGNVFVKVQLVSVKSRKTIVTVHDDGGGLPKGTSDFLTGRTQALHSSGLGIGIVRDLAGKLRGSVDYVYEKGAKITVAFYLSYCKRSDKKLRNKSLDLSPVRKPPVEKPKFSNARLCGVDDDICNRRILERMFRNVSSITLLPLAEHVFDELNKGAMSPNVFLMDFGMPSGHMNGINATRMLRLKGFCGFVIGLTGNTERKVLDEGLQAGMDVVLTKPYSKESLYRELNRAEECNYISPRHRCYTKAASDCGSEDLDVKFPPLPSP